jgi:hypothetical protein
MSNDTTFTREPNRRTGRARANGRNNGRFTDDADWAEVPPEDLAHYLSRLVRCGACCILSRSSDGGVLSLTVLYGNERFRAFPRSGDDALDALKDIVEHLGA